MTKEERERVIEIVRSVDAPELTCEFVNGWYKAQSAIVEALEKTVEVDK